MASSRIRAARRAAAQGLMVGLLTFVLIIMVEYMWAGGLVDLRLYGLTSLGVSILVFFNLLLTRHQRRPRQEATDRSHRRH
ncbi:hypothetical protein ACMDCT_07140 [Halomonadaceae bacterium KBTZ08]